MATAADVADRMDDCRQAPVAALMFVMASRERFSVERVLDPAVACVLASAALSQLNPWTGSNAAVRSAALDAARTPAVSALMRNVLSDPRTAWWNAPLDRGRQLQLLGADERGSDSTVLTAPAGPISSWDNYAQKPHHRVVTTTQLDGTEDAEVRSSGHAELAVGSSDWAPEYPVDQRSLQITSEARVYEVHSATDWHDLVRRYGDLGTYRGSDTSLRDSAGISNGPAPTWSAAENRARSRGAVVCLAVADWIPDDLRPCPGAAVRRLAQHLRLVDKDVLGLLAAYDGWKGHTRRDHRVRVLRLG